MAFTLYADNHEGDKLKIHEHPEIILLEPALYA